MQQVTPLYVSGARGDAPAEASADSATAHRCDDSANNANAGCWPSLWMKENSGCLHLSLQTANIQHQSCPLSHQTKTKEEAVLEKRSN
jgi:hypothetical protein